MYVLHIPLPTVTESVKTSPQGHVAAAMQATRCSSCLQGATPPPLPAEPDQEHAASQQEALFIQRMDESIKVRHPSAGIHTPLWPPD